MTEQDPRAAEEVSDGTEAFAPPAKPGEEELTSEQVLTPDEEVSLTEAIMIGRRERTVYLYDHKFRLKTLTVDEELQIALVAKKWLGTDGYPRAYKTVIVAASLVELDGEPFFVPISREDEDEIVRKKFEKLKRYYPVLVDPLYAEFSKLEQELAPLLEKLGKSSG
ncbi:hypothetical protein [Streptomyces sp. CoH17]|uniref:hypothetical protein n=1 Tax=Streptomyces sp. CoH17 TaxID=2992806 RepID=UPI0022714A87|nr:hypothetical protein [Streptomyces sp. CoH17]